MRENDDGKTVAAMDVLVPGVGELIGGSQREERLEVSWQTLMLGLQDFLPPDAYQLQPAVALSAVLVRCGLLESRVQALSAERPVHLCSTFSGASRSWACLWSLTRATWTLESTAVCPTLVLAWALSAWSSSQQAWRTFVKSSPFPDGQAMQSSEKPSILITKRTPKTSTVHALQSRALHKCWSSQGYAFGAVCPSAFNLFVGRALLVEDRQAQML